MEDAGSTLRPRVTIREEPSFASKLDVGSKEGLLGFASGLVAGLVGVVTGYPFDGNQRLLGGV